MIQIYHPDNTDYEKNGNMSLFPVSAETSAGINDLWEASLKHPVDQEGRWRHLQEDAVIKMPSFNGEQLFRIRKIHKSDSAIVCSMEPIFFDSIDDCFLEDVRPTDKSGQAALSMMLMANTKYRAQSDIKRISTAYYQDMNFMEGLNGNIEHSFINRWGGEICYDNFTVIVNEQLGEDRGVELRYGKNIKRDGLTEEVDTREVVTRIKPKAYNGHCMSGSGFVDSPNIGKYPTIRTRVIKFEDVKMVGDAMEDDAENGVIVCNTQEELDAALLKKCQEQYNLGLDKPKVTITADMVLLQNTQEYEEFAELEKVSLGDTVHCRHEVLDIVTGARVISLKYDSIRKKVISVTIGDYKNDYFNQIDTSVKKLEAQIENPDSPFRKSMQKLIDDMAAAIAGYDGGNMIITQNSNGKPNGIMIMDTESKDTAEKILWLNLNGITYSSNGVKGPFNAVWSFEKGGFVADWIVAGTMLANIIRGGTLTLGGSENGNGVMQILGADEKVIGTWNSKGITANLGTIGRWKFDEYNFTGNKADGKSGFVFYYNKEKDKFYFVCDGNIEAGELLQTQDMTVWGNLDVYGAKNRVVKTSGGNVRMSAYETASPYFGDIGTDVINSDGMCRVGIETVFAETVSLEEYVVFLQAEGSGKVFVKEKDEKGFWVEGEPGMKFSYEVKAKQKGFQKIRMEVVK